MQMQTHIHIYIYIYIYICNYKYKSNYKYKCKSNLNTNTQACTFKEYIDALFSCAQTLNHSTMNVSCMLHKCMHMHELCVVVLCADIIPKQKEHMQHKIMFHMQHGSMAAYTITKCTTYMLACWCASRCRDAEMQVSSI
jgi:hypothetical protein